jgi:hypothetical protein
MKGRHLVLVLVAASGLAGSSTGRAQLGPLGPQFQVNVWTTGSQSGPAVARDGAGNFVVVWTSFGSAGTDVSDRSVQGRRYDATGMPVGGEFQVNTWTTSTQHEPAVACDAAGNFIVVWTSWGSAGSDTDAGSIQARRYDAAGMPLGAEFQVNVYTTDLQRSAAVASDGGAGFVVVWSSPGSAGTDTSSQSIQGRRYDAAGMPLGGEFQVNTYTSSFQDTPVVVANAAGSFVAWLSFGGGTDSSLSSIQAQRYDAAGTPLGPQFQVNTWTTGYQGYPAAAIDGAGNVIVAWASDALDPEGGIEARRYDAAGTPLGPEFQVKTYVPYSVQTRPAVAADVSGNFLVVWNSLAGFSPEWHFSVQGQRYDVAGAPLGGEFKVNALGDDDGFDPPAIANTAGADFVVLWESVASGALDGDAKSVQGQLLSPSAPTTTTSSVTSTTSTSSSTLPPTALVPGRMLQILPESVRFVARPANGNFPLPAADPTVVGGEFRIFDTIFDPMMFGGGANTYPLPAAGWSGLGSPPGSVGWLYQGAGTVYDPCRMVLVKRRTLKALCDGPGILLGAPFNGEAGIVLSLGTTDRYCASFGGRHLRNDLVLLRRRAPAPASCPTQATYP